MVRISKARISMEDGRVDRSILKDYGETAVGGAAGTNAGSTYTVDMESGNVFNLILNANCTFTFSNPPASATAGSFTLILKQDATGVRGVTWPAAVVWQNGTLPILTATASRFDVFTFSTANGGATWLGVVAGYNFS